MKLATKQSVFTSKFFQALTIHPNITITPNLLCSSWNIFAVSLYQTKGKRIGLRTNLRQLTNRITCH